jgi:hypothetical protein
VPSVQDLSAATNSKERIPPALPTCSLTNRANLLSRDQAVAQEYVGAVLARPEVIEWVSAAERESDRIAHYDDAVGADGRTGAARL